MPHDEVEADQLASPHLDGANPAMPRHFPPPWTVEQIPGGYKVKDANGQALALRARGGGGVS